MRTFRNMAVLGTAASNRRHSGHAGAPLDAAAKAR